MKLVILKHLWIKFWLSKKELTPLCKHVAVKLLYQNDAVDAYRMQSANLHWLELYWLKGFQRYWKRHCRFSNGPKLRVLHIKLGSIINTYFFIDFSWFKISQCLFFDRKTIRMCRGRLKFSESNVRNLGLKELLS